MHAGCGLPPGPSGLLGAAEGISYLSVIGIAVWGLVSKVSSGKGLPAGLSMSFASVTHNLILRDIGKLLQEMYGTFLSVRRANLNRTPSTLWI